MFLFSNVNKFQFTLQTCLQTDPSDFAQGAALCHLVQQDGKLVCYASKTLDRAQPNYSAHKKACLAIVWSTDLFSTLCFGHQLVLQTDHCALKQLSTNKQQLDGWHDGPWNYRNLTWWSSIEKERIKEMLIFYHDWYTIWMGNSL